MPESSAIAPSRPPRESLRATELLWRLLLECELVGCTLVILRFLLGLFVCSKKLKTR